jgi:hypothetical protein
LITERDECVYTLFIAHYADGDEQVEVKLRVDSAEFEAFPAEVQAQVLGRVMAEQQETKRERTPFGASHANNTASASKQAGRMTTPVKQQVPMGTQETPMKTRRDDDIDVFLPSQDEPAGSASSASCPASGGDVVVAPS